MHRKPKPKRGQRTHTNARTQALRNYTPKKTPTGTKGGATVGA